MTPLTCPHCGRGLELVAARSEAPAAPAVHATPRATRKNSSRHTPAQWAEARRWVEHDGLTDEEAARRLGVRLTTFRQRRYSEKWQRAFRRPPVILPEPAAAPKRQLVPPPPRDLAEAVRHDCGKWTRVSPCWHCKRAVAA